MRTSATHFKNHFGEYIQKVYQEPIIVEKSGKPSVVLISYDAFERFSEIEDLYWGLKANQAIEEGFLGAEESEKRLKDYAEKAGIKINNETTSKTETD